MKQLLKKFKIFLCLILATFLYYSCTQEKEYINEKNRINFDLKEKSLKEALDMPIFSTAYSKLTKMNFSSRTSETARTAIEDQFGFTIVPDVPIKIITRDDGTVLFYILIEREIKEELKFENLIIQVKNNETSAAVFKYTMGEKAVKTLTNDYAIKEIVNSQYTDLNIDGKMFFNSGGETCFDIMIFKCDAVLGYTHSAFSDCFRNGTAYAVSSTTCMGDGGGPSSAEPQNGSVTVTTGGAAPNEPVEAFVLPCHSPNCIESAIKTPCEALNDLFNINKGNISSTLTLVNNMTVGIDAERGAYFTKVGSTYGHQTIAVGTGVDAFAYSVNLPTGLTIPGVYAAVHSHPFDFYAAPMFSFTDLKYLLDLYRYASPEDREDVVFMLLLPNGSTYALKIDNYFTLLTYFSSYNNLESVKKAYIKKKEMNRVFDKRISNASKQGDADMEEKYVRGFLDEMKNHGVSLYKKTIITHPLNSSLVEGWEKLNPPINPSGTEIVKSSCN